MVQLPDLRGAKGVVSRRTVALAAAALAVLGLLYGGLSAYDAKREVQAEDASQATRIMASRLAIALSASFKPQTQALRGVAQDPRVVAALSRADRPALRRLADEVAAQIPGALRLRLILPNTVEPDTAEPPPLEYAGLNLLRQAALVERQVPIEFHLSDRPERHIAIVSRVPPEGMLVGFLHLAVPAALVQERLSALDAQTYRLELRQPLPGQASALIATTGGDSSRSEELVRAPVPGTAWQLVVMGQNRAVLSEFVDGPVLLAAGLMVLLLLAALLYVSRQRGRRSTSAEGPNYQGAILAIYNGEYPGLEGLVRGTAPLPEAPRRPGVSPQAAEPAADPAIDTSLFEGISDNDFIDLVPDDPVEPALPEAPGAPVAQVIFRAYDIRGVAEETLTDDAVYQIGRAIASEATTHGHQTVLVGRDGRRSSPVLHEALLKGLRESGLDVLDLGLVPTPLLYFATNYLDIPTGVMLTGSHNPAQYNGLKVVINGTTLSGDAIQAIRRRVNQQDFTRGNGSLHQMDIIPDYIRQISEDIPVALTRPMKVVVDCANAVPGLVVPQVLRALGHDVIELNCELDGEFPNHPPDPSQPGNLEDLMLAVKLQSADVGLAFDGDGDRLGVVDSTGKVIWPDRQLMLFARDLLSRNPGAKVVFDVKCSSKLGREIRAAGGEPIMWKSGHSLIKSKMQEVGALLGGEMTGHLFFREGWFGFDDGIYASARLLEILVQEKRTPAAVFASLPDTLATPEILLPLAEEYHEGFMESILAAATFEGAERTLIDGLRVEYPDRWGLVRPSNTSASIVLRFEGDTRAALHHIQQEFRQLLQQVDPSLKIPF